MPYSHSSAAYSLQMSFPGLEVEKLIGQIYDFQSPPWTFEVEDYINGTGVINERETNLAKPECSFTVVSFRPEWVEAFMVNKDVDGEPAMLIFRQSLTDAQRNPEKKMMYTSTGHIRSLAPSVVDQNGSSNMPVIWSIDTWNWYIDDDDIALLEFDRLNQIFKVKGQEVYWTQRRRNLGLES